MAGAFGNNACRAVDMFEQHAHPHALCIYDGQLHSCTLHVVLCFHPPVLLKVLSVAVV